MDKRSKEYKVLKRTALLVGKPVEELLPPGEKIEESAPVAEVPEVKKPTKPWEKTTPNKPWHMDMLKLERKREGFRARWVDKDKVESRLLRGYDFADPKHYGELTARIVGESSKSDGKIRRRELILMEIPEEGAQAYERMNQEIIKRRKRDSKDIVVAQAKKLLEKHGIKVTITDESSDK